MTSGTRCASSFRRSRVSSTPPGAPVSSASPSAGGDLSLRLKPGASRRADESRSTESRATESRRCRAMAPSLHPPRAKQQR